MKCFEGTCRFSFQVFVWCWMSSHIVMSTLGQFFEPLKVLVPVLTKFDENWRQGISSLRHEMPSIQNNRKYLEHIHQKYSVILSSIYSFIVRDFNWLLVWKAAHHCRWHQDNSNWNLSSKELLSWGRRILPTNLKRNYLTKSILTISISVVERQ